jgi:16S rRNA (uracil1498-N3)-methyltransferase
MTENSLDLKPTKVARPSRYAAAADGPLEFPFLELEKPFDFDRDLARRLILREVNPKEAFSVKDSSGVFFRASVKELGEQGGIAVPYEKFLSSPEPSIEITLACAVLARQRMLFVAQKATELGVSRIVPLLTEHSVPVSGLDHEKAHAWPGQIIRAAKQCRRSSLPELCAPMTLEAFLSSPISLQSDLRICLDDTVSPFRIHKENPHSIILFVGPEGGFSDSERALFKDKVQFLTFGGRILRAETAVLAGLTTTQLLLGDFRNPLGAFSTKT